MTFVEEVFSELFSIKVKGKTMAKTIPISNNTDKMVKAILVDLFILLLFSQQCLTCLFKHLYNYFVFSKSFLSCLCQAVFQITSARWTPEKHLKMINVSVYNTHTSLLSLYKTMVQSIRIEKIEEGFVKYGFV